jgi:hypothetical protein
MNLSIQCLDFTFDFAIFNFKPVSKSFPGMFSTNLFLVLSKFGVS